MFYVTTINSSGADPQLVKAVIKITFNSIFWSTNHLPVASCECETYFLDVTEENNRCLRTGRWREYSGHRKEAQCRRRNEETKKSVKWELHNFYSPLYITRLTKSGIIIWAGHRYKMLFINPRGTDHLGHLGIGGKLILQDCKGVLFGVHWLFKGVLHATGCCCSNVIRSYCCVLGHNFTNVTPGNRG
jgi:hypothetical protein